MLELKGRKTKEDEKVNGIEKKYWVQLTAKNKRYMIKAHQRFLDNKMSYKDFNKMATDVIYYQKQFAEETRKIGLVKDYWSQLSPANKLEMSIFGRGMTDKGFKDMVIDALEEQNKE